MAEQAHAEEVGDMPEDEPHRPRFLDSPYRRRLSLQELAEIQGVKPFTSLEEAARPDMFESDEEVEEFIAWVRERRNASITIVDLGDDRSPDDD